MLFLIGVDPLRDYPDAALATQALQNVERAVVQSLELGSLEPYADAFLPAAAFLEKDGHVTTWEGRSQRIRPIRGAAGISLPDWEIFASLALARGGDLGFETLDELHDEMGRLLAPRERRGARASAAPAPSRRHGRRRRRAAPLHVPAAGRRGPALRARRRAEGGARRTSRSWRSTRATPPRAAWSTAAGRSVRTAAGEAELPVRVTEHVAEGSVVRAVQPAGVRGEHDPARLVLDRRRTSSRSTPARRARDGRGRGGRREPDGLARLAPADRAGRRGVLRAADRGDALHLDGAQGDRRLPDARGARCAPGRGGSSITLADGIKLFFKEGITPDERRPGRLRDRADPRDRAGVPGVRRHPVRHAGRRSSDAPSRSNSPT